MFCGHRHGVGQRLHGGNKTAYLHIAEDREWWETALEIAVGLAMGRGSFLGKIGCLAMGAVVGMAGEALGRGFRALIGYPVHPATGGKVLDGGIDTDFVLPGPLPIEWRRFYSNHDHRSDTLHGEGWSVPYEIELHIVRAVEGAAPERITYVNPQGRHIDLPRSSREPRSSTRPKASFWAAHRAGTTRWVDSTM